MISLVTKQNNLWCGCGVNTSKSYLQFIWCRLIHDSKIIEHEHSNTQTQYMRSTDIFYGTPAIIELQFLWHNWRWVSWWIDWVVYWRIIVGPTEIHWSNINKRFSIRSIRFQLVLVVDIIKYTRSALVKSLMSKKLLWIQRRTLASPSRHWSHALCELTFIARMQCNLNNNKNNWTLTVAHQDSYNIFVDMMFKFVDRHKQWSLSSSIDRSENCHLKPE